MANIVRKFEINPRQIRPVLGEIARGLTADQVVDLFDVLSDFIMGKPLLIIFKTVEIVIQLIAPSLRPEAGGDKLDYYCLLYTSPSPRDLSTSRMPSSA